MEPEIFRVKVFSEDARFGNLAGVVPYAEKLDSSAMQAVAQRVNASETAFILPSRLANFKLRWFTPNTEVGICIHATIATLGTLERLNLLKVQEVFIETCHTILQAKKMKGKWFVRVDDYMVLRDPVDSYSVCELLKLKESALLGPLRLIQIFNDKELLVPVRSLLVLKELAPDMEDYAALCNRMSITGISIFTPETFDLSNSYHTREFAPLYGYLEDPLCGMAAGAIGAYLSDLGKKDPIQVEQGHFLQLPGRIEVVPEDRYFWIGGSYAILETELA